MAVAGPLRGCPYGPPPPSARFGPPRPCSRRGRAVLGFRGYALPRQRFGRLRHCPAPAPAAAQRPHRAKDRPPAAQRPHRERPNPRGRSGWTAQGRAARPDRPQREGSARPDRPTACRPTNEARGPNGRPAPPMLARSSLVARSFLARCALRAPRRGAQREPRRGGEGRSPAHSLGADGAHGPGGKGVKKNLPRCKALMGLLGRCN